MTGSLLFPWALLGAVLVIAYVREGVIRYWRTRADYWMGRAVRAEGSSSGIDPRIAKMPDAKVREIVHHLRHGFPDEARDFPKDLLIGSVANPLKLIREDARLNDTARAGYVEDFFTRVVP